ncbi:hypothetical protein EJ110_NYTH50414 [Nymphaea thermarum]|nr:hypothetical protein EJ110_NYTH50414 [Nymphaea thermarum]
MTAKRAPKAEKRTNPRGVLPRKEEGTIGGKQEDPIVPRFPSSASSSSSALPASCQKSQRQASALARMNEKASVSKELCNKQRKASGSFLLSLLNLLTVVSLIFDRSFFHFYDICAFPFSILDSFGEAGLICVAWLWSRSCVLKVDEEPTGSKEREGDRFFNIIGASPTGYWRC